MSKATAYRKRQAEQPGLTAEVALPSGAVFTMRRPPLDIWIASGRIPQSFVKQLMAAQSKGEDGGLDLTPEEILDALQFTRDALLYAVVEPKLKVGATEQDEELDPSELDPADFEFLTQWILQGSPGVPVATKGGVASVSSLTTFRQKKPGGGFVEPGIDGAEVREAPEPIASVG